ncbi:Telomerase reverse transcriptase [Lachnellula cervina]|uniref:Telomerase reverse transcriptase n=1 Tax=Lachnellula cervina TaxID=1316786 RepID=A0A7D8YWA3_9HELO|nr:Telomerase reverse transcriptase [Lachnellula cervina]
MFLDTSYNSLSTVLSNIHSAFLETATKTWTYIRLLPPSKKPRTELLKKTIIDTIELAFVLMKSKGRNGNKGNVGYRCKVTKVMVEWLAMHAFTNVLKKRQSGYGGIISWLEGKIRSLGVRDRRMDGIVGGSGRGVGGGGGGEVF